MEEQTEQKRLLDELVEIGEETERRVEEENDMRKTVAEKERRQAVEMRQIALERIGVIRKRRRSG